MEPMRPDIMPPPTAAGGAAAGAAAGGGAAAGAAAGGGAAAAGAAAGLGAAAGALLPKEGGGAARWGAEPDERLLARGMVPVCLASHRGGAGAWERSTGPIGR